MSPARYGSRVADILACPFCRELFTEGEGEECPECKIALRPLAALPPSFDALAAEVEEGEVIAPEDRLLPWYDFRRGRGALLVVAVLGLFFFFAPWVHMTRPELVDISGYHLARGRAGWLWGGAVGWFVMIPLVWTRRTVYKMRGVRIICAFFAAMTLGEVGMMLALPPQGSRYLSVAFEWGYGLYGSGVVALLGIIFSTRFGGNLRDLSALPWLSKQAVADSESSAGETLH